MSTIYIQTISVHPFDDPINKIKINTIHNGFDNIKDSVLLLHGYLGNTSDYLNIISALHENYNLVACDVRGHGYSDTPMDYIWSISNLANDFIQVLDVLIPKYKKISIVASSLSTAVALEIASIQPNRIDKLFLISATDKFIIPNWGKIYIGYTKLMSSTFQYHVVDKISKVLMKMNTNIDSEDVDIGKNRIRQMNNKVHQKLYEDAITKWNVRAEIIDHPVFIIAGTDDVIIPYESSVKLHSKLINSSLLTIHGEHHMILRKQNDLILEILIDWLDDPDNVLINANYCNNHIDLHNNQVNLTVCD
ncbi:MAG: alpha/beta hydrolase [Candidatus Heimdallarchaeota archaeon]|nr:alpha/beta hydrolase [Candidatus Heimdallarchaeota archaeon]MDH5645773.1 alpha/beta hydrolase [Candidatus Heimdallarchaeota archaeon]